MRSAPSIKFIKAAKIGYIIMALVFCVFGVLMFVYPETSTRIICYASGIMLMIFGVIKIIGYLSKDLYRLAFQFDLAFGILIITLGVIMLMHSDAMIHLFYTMFGVLILSDGLFKIQLSIDAKTFGISQWWLILATAITTGVFGTILILHPVLSAEVMTMFFGLAMLAEGSLSIIVALSAIKVMEIKYPNLDD